jgi:hypothetical protein
VWAAAENLRAVRPLFGRHPPRCAIPPPLGEGRHTPRRRDVLSADHSTTLSSANNLVVDLAGIGAYVRARPLAEDTPAAAACVATATRTPCPRRTTSLGCSARCGKPRRHVASRRPPPSTLSSANNLVVDLAAMGAHSPPAGAACSATATRTPCRRRTAWRAFSGSRADTRRPAASMRTPCDVVRRFSARTVPTPCFRQHPPRPLLIAGLAAAYPARPDGGHSRGRPVRADRRLGVPPAGGGGAARAARWPGERNE